ECIAHDEPHVACSGDHWEPIDDERTCRNLLGAHALSVDEDIHGRGYDRGSARREEGRRDEVRANPEIRSPVNPPIANRAAPTTRVADGIAEREGLETPSEIVCKGRVEADALADPLGGPLDTGIGEHAR